LNRRTQRQQRNKNHFLYASSSRLLELVYSAASAPSCSNLTSGTYRTDEAKSQLEQEDAEAAEKQSAQTVRAHHL
jgi:hypothetical protein